MKNKLIRSILITGVIFCMAALASCSSEQKQLETPRELKVEGETLSWSEVKNASGYGIELDGEEYESGTNSFDLFLLTTEARKYEIRVRAYSEQSGHDDSDWSSVLSYTPKIAEGLIFEPAEDKNSVIVRADPKSNPSGKLVIPEKDPESGKTVTELRFLAFENCKDITGAIISGEVSTVGSHAFMNCTGLLRVHFSDLVENIGAEALMGCTSLTEVRLPANIEMINTGLFLDCSSLSEITVPGTVETIKPCAFKGTAISSMKIPAMVKKLEYGIFSDCAELTSITVDEANPYFYSENNCILKRKDRTLCYGIKTSRIPDYVTVIGDGAFAGILGLTEVVLPPNVETVGCFAFDGCRDLESVTFNDGLKTIGRGMSSVFLDCDNLKRVFIPASVEFIGYGIFATCGSITDITVDPANKIYKNDRDCIIRIADSAYITCGASDYIPEYVKIIEMHAFAGHKFSGGLSVPEGVEKICSYAFGGSSIVSIILPDSMKEIIVDAFDDCLKISYVEVPSSDVWVYQELFKPFSGSNRNVKLVIRNK